MHYNFLALLVENHQTKNNSNALSFLPSLINEIPSLNDSAHKL